MSDNNQIKIKKDVDGHLNFSRQSEITSEKILSKDYNSEKINTNLKPIRKSGKEE